MIEEYKKNGYVIFDNLLPEKEYKKILDICKNSSYIKISQKRADRYALWETPDDKFFPDSDEVYQNQLVNLCTKPICIVIMLRIF